MTALAARRPVLLVRARAWLCALPAEDVVETMRPLPIEPVAGAPRCVKGIAVIRGEPVPVLSLPLLLGAETPVEGRRMVLVRAGAHRIALEVEDVLDVEELDPANLGGLPPLLSEALPAEVERLGTLDGKALALLDAARLLPEAALRALTGTDAP
ncbi:chemotaxis protein CheW [Polyangium aurulentum]|uniref:chemotaxis protein CheW n=1 Tax=Polyangium aurulentum TaxID=2567896 RepID=UPI0010AEC6F3|nr:chemotaxis protein CheW [Polyangium aurulentum]UQA60747.1 chemotaxis protein CheW [Polyangium aurulentum]